MTFLRLAVLFVATLTLLASCKRKQKLSPEMERQRQALVQAAVDSCERLLDRQLTEAERQCIVVEVEDGKLRRSHIAQPLADALKARQAELLRQSQTSSQPRSATQPISR
jgi:hypothetical protein